MYAVIRAGGKQYKVAKGDVIEVERVAEGDSIDFTPLLVVDDKGKARSSRSELKDARVTAKIVGESKGPKIDVMKYRSKSRTRRHTGHRQRYTTLQIEDIKLTAGRSKKTSSGDKEGEEVVSDGS
jgi:large subunit ribosomal protein L21